MLYSNRSAALLGHGQPLAALNDAKRAIELDSRWSKPYYRAALASIELEDYDDARYFLESAALISPTDNQIRNSLSDISQNQNFRNDRGRRVFDSGIYTWGSGAMGQLGCVHHKFYLT